MDGIFKFIPTKGKLVCTNPEDLEKWCMENDGILQTGHLKETGDPGAKEAMYAFYHKVVLRYALRAFTNQGWELMDEVKADALLKHECAKDIMYNPVLDREQIYFQDKAKMNKKRLWKFIADCVHYLETEHEMQIPNSSEYKEQVKDQNPNLRSVKQELKRGYDDGTCSRCGIVPEKSGGCTNYTDCPNRPENKVVDN